MFKQFSRKFSTQFKPVYSTKEYVDLYINNSKDKFEMQNKVIFSSITLLFGTVGWVVINMDKRFEQVDKRFEHIESEIKEIKKIIIEGFSKNKK